MTLSMIIALACIIAIMLYFAVNRPLQCLIFAIICPIAFYLAHISGFYTFPHFYFDVSRVIDMGDLDFLDSGDLDSETLYLQELPDSEMLDSELDSETDLPDSENSQDFSNTAPLFRI